MKKTLYPTPSKRTLLLGVLYMGFSSLLLPSLVLLLNRQLEVPLTTARLNCLIFTINFALETLIFWRFLRDSFTEFQRRIYPSLLAALQGMGLYWAGNLVISFLILSIDPEFINVNDSNIAAMAAKDFGLMAFCTVLLVPIAEELLYRGILFGGLYNRNRIAAFGVSTAVFCAIHIAPYVGVYPPQTLLLCFLQYIPAGLALGWSWTRSGNIFSPIMMHITINAMGILAMR